MKKNVFIIGILVVVIMGYFVFSRKDQKTIQLPRKSELSSPTPLEADKFGRKTFIFNNFHGEEVIGGGFKFEYPANWHNNGQYFSPQKIEYYDLASVDAPIYFDLISENIFESSDLRYQIATDKKNQPDVILTIDGKKFRKFDLIDYGSSGGESTGRVIIYLGPIVSFNDRSYYLVFRWEEKPLTLYIPGNDSKIFENMVATLRFML